MSKIKPPPHEVGTWQVLGEAGRDQSSRQVRWRLRCTGCQNEIDALGQSLRLGKPPWCLTCDPITYAGAHSRVYRLRGKASEHVCRWGDCHKPAIDWALMYGWTPSAERVGPERPSRPEVRRYSVDPGSYTPMCKAHHKQWDGLQLVR